MNNSVNPYHQRGMIREPDDRFFGRTRELREAFSLLKTMQSVSVVGERRIGKSSFLRRLASPHNDELDKSFTLHYLDLQRVFSAQEFYARACRKLDRETGDSHLELEEAIQDKKVIFCLDEFEQAYEKDFGGEFFNALRSLAQTGNLALVVATQTPLNELHAQFLQDADVTSKFHNIFTRLNLGEFTPEEARQMATAPRGDHRFSDDEASAILQFGGTHPYKLNLACSIFFDVKQRGLLPDGKVSDAIRKQLREQFDVELNGVSALPSSGHNGSARQSYVASPSKKSAPTTVTTDASSAAATVKPTAQAARAQRAIRISVALSLVAGVLIFFATESPNPVSLFLSGGLLLVSLGFLIATKMMWPKETRGGEQ